MGSKQEVIHIMLATAAMKIKTIFLKHATFKSIKFYRTKDLNNDHMTFELRFTITATSQQKITA